MRKPLALLVSHKRARQRTQVRAGHTHNRFFAHRRWILPNASWSPVFCSKRLRLAAALEPTGDTNPNVRDIKIKIVDPGAAACETAANPNGANCNRVRVTRHNSCVYSIYAVLCVADVAALAS